jgi:hypothetical protein
MTVKTVDNRIRLRALLDDDDRQGKAVGFQRRLQQAFFRWRHVIRIVVVGDDLLLFYPQHAVNGLGAEGTALVEHLTKRIDCLDARLVIQRLQISVQRLRQLLLHNIPHCWRCFSMRLR